MVPNRVEPIRVLVVDDHDLVRRSVKAVLQAAGDIVVCGEASAGEEAERIAAATAPDVVIVDLRLGGESGICAGREIRARRPATHVILLTSSTDEDAAFSAVLAGADGYLVKQLRGNDLVGAVRSAARGGRFSNAPSPGALDRLRVAALSAGADTAPTDQAAADARARLLDLIIDGRTNSEMAELLHVDESTIRRGVSSVVAGFAEVRPTPTFPPQPDIPAE